MNMQQRTNQASKSTKQTIGIFEARKTKVASDPESIKYSYNKGMEPLAAPNDPRRGEVWGRERAYSAWTQVGGTSSEAITTRSASGESPRSERIMTRVAT